MSPDSRPVNVTPAPNSHTSSRIHVGTSDSARSCPRSARNSVSAAADARRWRCWRGARTWRPGADRGRRWRSRTSCAAIHSPNSMRTKPCQSSQPQEGVEEDDQQRRGHGGLARRRGIARSPRAHVEQLVPEAEVDAQVGQHAPREERRGREDRLVVGGEHRRQEDRQQAGDAEHDAVEQLAVARSSARTRAPSTGRGARSGRRPARRRR